MKLIIFSDIHGNAEALEAFLNQSVIHTEDMVVFCGDIAGYYYDAAECIELMGRIHHFIAVRGNHDQYYINAFHDERLTERLVKNYGVSYRIKDERIFAFLTGLPLQRQIKRNGCQILIQHGSPEEPLEGRIYPDTQLKAEAENTIYVCGHTHYQMYRKKGTNIWINSGSLGQPRDGKGFSYCVFDMENKEMEFHTISLDTRNLILKVESNDPGNPYLKEVLCRNGRKR